MKYYSQEASYTVHLNPQSVDVIQVPPRQDNWAFARALLAIGFEKISERTFKPCLKGTFSNFSGKENQKCVECPPGGFYSDTLGYVAEGCKKCPKGSYVAYDERPGKSVSDCKTCPLGTESDFFAGFRACQCLKEHYRTHLFHGCYKCGQNGLKCQDDYASLKRGHWWQWRNESYKYRYEDFIKNLLASLPALDELSVQYPYPIPTPYKCPVEESCKGGLHSKCTLGYEGPLCAVCSSGYYKQLKPCTKCPSKPWVVGQLSVITLIITSIIAFAVWKRRQKSGENRGKYVIDTIFSKFKIVIGFYQVTYGLLQAFSYIKWPDSLQDVAKYSGILQMNFLQVSPIHCLSSGLSMDAFEDLSLILSINATVIVLSFLVYVLRKVYINRNRSLENEEKLNEISQTKELVCRNLFFFLYVTYLGTCTKTANVLPFACRKICRDENEDSCNEYLKSDYSIKCHGSMYNQLVIIAYISAAYTFALPTASFIALWRHRKVPQTSTAGELSHDSKVVAGLRFLFENYKSRSWYWELVETSRKVILTSVLILVGQESRSYIGLAWVVAGMYGVLFSWIKPIQDSFENRLMTTSLAVTVVNLGVGAVSKIPAENVSMDFDINTDALAMKILILGANTLVISLLVVQYLVYLRQYFREWRKNPQWSFACCLALLLPLNDMQGDIQGVAGTNILDTQLETGMMDKPSIAGCVQDSGTLSFALAPADGDDGVHLESKEKISADAGKPTLVKSNRGTQTELFTLSADAVAVRHSFEDTHM